jgi:predicted transcriptional regulator
VFPTEQNLRFQLQGIGSATKLKAKESLSDAEVIRHAVEANGDITATRLCLKANVTIEEATKKLDQLHTKGVFDIQTSDEGGFFYALNDKSLLS